MNETETHLLIGLLLLALATVGTYLYYVLFDEEIVPLFRLLFIGNVLAYVIWWLYRVVLLRGCSTLSNIGKAIEASLIVLLLVEACVAKSRVQHAGR